MQLASRSVSSRLAGHAYVVGALGLFALGLSFLLWFHPTAGFAQGGILDGADLRADAIQILWWQTLVFIAGSTIAISLLPVRGRVRFAIGYLLGFASCFAMMPLIDRFY